MLFMRFCSAKILDGSRQSTQPEIVARELDRDRERWWMGRGETGLPVELGYGQHDGGRWLAKANKL